MSDTKHVEMQIRDSSEKKGYKQEVNVFVSDLRGLSSVQMRFSLCQERKKEISLERKKQNKKQTHFYPTVVV